MLVSVGRMTKRLRRPWYVLLFLVSCGQPDTTWTNRPANEQALATSPPVVAAVMGDYGVASNAEHQVAQLIKSWKPALVVTTGDNNYPDGAESSLDNNIGQFYHAFIRFGPHYQGRYRNAGAAEQAFFPTLGNHDWRTAHAGPYMRYFDLPGNKRYYSVRRGALEFFLLDSDPHEPDGTHATSTQGHWLKAAMGASSARWKLVAFHHPPYSTGMHGGSPTMRWPFKAWGATAVLSGHDHHYERIMMGGLPYIVVGTGGAPLRGASGGHPGAQRDVVYTRNHGAVRITADDDALAIDFYNTGGQLIDRFVTSEPHLDSMLDAETSPSHGL